MKTNMNIEQEFAQIKARPVIRMDSYDIMTKILYRMLAGNKHWYFSKEFVDIHYKAPARLSDLLVFYPDLIEARALSNQHGAPKLYRLKQKSSKFPKWAVDNSLHRVA